MENLLKMKQKKCFLGLKSKVSRSLLGVKRMKNN